MSRHMYCNDVALEKLVYSVFILAGLFAKDNRCISST